MAVHVTSADYESIRGFFVWMMENQMEFPEGRPPEDYPVAMLSKFEREAGGMAPLSVGLGIGFVLAVTADLSAEQERAINERLSAVGLITLSEVKERFGDPLHLVMWRGKVLDEDEYYSLRNAVESMSEPDQIEARRLLGEFETRLD